MEKLTQQEINGVKELLGRLDTLYKEKISLELVSKEREDNLKDDVASAFDYRNKEGELDAKRVKMPLLLSVLQEIYNDVENKKKIEFETLKDYEEALKEKRISEDLAKSYIETLNQIKETDSSIKEVFKEYPHLDKEVLNAINAIAKENYKQNKNAELEKAGYEVKEPKDNSELKALIQELKKLLSIKE